MARRQQGGVRALRHRPGMRARVGLVQAPEGPTQLHPSVPAGAEETGKLLPLSAGELRDIKAVIAVPLYRRVIQAQDERIIEAPYPFRETFKSAAAALRVRLYHGPTPATPPVEDFSSGTIRGRRGFLEGTPGLARMFLGFPFVGQLLTNWILDAEVRVLERNGRVLVGIRMHTTLPQWVGNGLVTSELEGILADLHRLQPGSATNVSIPHNPIVGPGIRAPDVFTGTLSDYSRCASLDELDSL